MEAQILLADSAQVDSNQKVHALGMGWAQCGSPTPPFALVILINTPWDQSNVRHDLLVELLDADGRNVLTNTEPDAVNVRIEGQFESGRPAGLPAGTPLTTSLAIPAGPGLNVQTGQAYVWRLSINGESKEHWSTRFFVQPLMPGHPGGA